VVLIGARLVAHGKSIEARPPRDDGERRHWTVPRKGTGELSPWWELDSLSQAQQWDLGPSITYSYRVRIGGEEHTLTVRMEQTSHARW
jgi:hypothetical protein